MTLKALLPFILLICPASSMAEDWNGFEEEIARPTYRQDLEGAEKDYRIRKKQLGATQAERKAGLEQFLREKDQAAVEKERQRKAYVQSRYGRKPASNNMLRMEEWQNKKNAYERAKYEKARMAHLRALDRREEVKAAVKKKFYSKETAVRDEKPWDE
jgi:hypothetical protein